MELCSAVQVWCEERRGMAKGQIVYYRSFLAASYASFWKSYEQLAAYARHCYEVLPLARKTGFSRQDHVGQFSAHAIDL